MGSTATSKAVKKTSTTVKKDSGKKKSARKTASKKAKPRTTPVKKKAATKKKAAAPKKATSKKTVGKKVTAKKKAPRKKATTRAGTTSARSPDRLAAMTAAPVKTPDPTDATAAAPGDANSLSWMAAQAASALKAVRANQNARAQELLAKAEITPCNPARASKEASILAASDRPETQQETQTDKTPAPVTTEAKKQADPDLTEIKKAKAADTTPKPVRAAVKQATKVSPATVPAKQATPDTSPPAQSAPVAQKPAKQETVKTAAARTAPAQPKISTNVVKDQPPTPPTHVIATTSKAPGNQRPIRLILFTGIIVLAGVLGARAWFSDKNSTDIAAVQDSAETEQVSPVTAAPAIAEPSIEVVTSTASEPTARPATAATQTNSWSPTAHPALPEPASSQETLPTVAATPPETPADEVMANETPQLQATPQATAATPQDTSPVAPQPAYYAPGYNGYYPQQPVRQQPYYRSRYSR